jgi:NTE family protein
MDDIEIDFSDIFEPKYKNIVFSGGSVKGISLIGAVKRLIDEGMIDLKKIEGVAGSSVGCIFGLLIVLGLTIDEIWDFIYSLDMKRLVEPNILLFPVACGVETGKIIHDLFENMIIKKTGIKNITFRQLYDLTKIHFTIVGSCLTTREAVYYDYINYPDFGVSLAVRISIGIPLFFTPVTIGKNKYIDGGVLNNYAMNLFDDKLDRTIGILICNDYNTNYRYLEEYFVAIMNLYMYQYYQKAATKYYANTVHIKKIPNNVFVLDFNVDNQTKLNLFECGVVAAEEFIRRYKNNRAIEEGDF